MKKLSFFMLIAMLAIASPFLPGCNNDDTGLGVNNVSTEMVFANIQIGEIILARGDTIFLDSGGPVNFSDNDQNSTSRTWRMLGNNNPNVYYTRDVTHNYNDVASVNLVTLKVTGPINSDSTHAYVAIRMGSGGTGGPRGEHFILYGTPYFNPANGKFVYPTGYNKLWFTGSNSSSPFHILDNQYAWFADTMGVDSIIIGNRPYWTELKQMWDSITYQSYGGYGGVNIPSNQWQYAWLDSSRYFIDAVDKLGITYFNAGVHKHSEVTIPLPATNGDILSRVLLWESTPTTYKVYLRMNNVANASGNNPWFLIYKNGQWVTPNNQEVTSRGYQTNGSGWYVIEITKSYITTLGTYTRIRFGCENVSQNNIDANYNGSIYYQDDPAFGGKHLRMPFVGM